MFTKRLTRSPFERASVSAHLNVLITSTIVTQPVINLNHDYCCGSSLSGPTEFEAEPRAVGSRLYSSYQLPVAVFLPLARPLRLVSYLRGRSGRCSFQAQLLGNRLLDNGILEKARIVARVQHYGIGERELSKKLFGDEARSENSIDNSPVRRYCSDRTKAGLNFSCIREIMQRDQFTRVIVPPPEAPAPLSA